MTGPIERTGGSGPSDDTVVLPVVPASPPPPEETGSVARNSATMALGSIVSRVTGLVRTAAIVAALGGYLVGDAYNLANTLPNMVYELLLGGVLASVIVPVLVRARRTDADRGEAYAQRLLTLAVVCFGVATVLAVLAAPLFTAVLATDAAADDRELITQLAYLLLPEIFFYGLAAIFAAILNTRGHFAAPMWTPILNNLVVIATAVAFLALLPRVDRDSASSMTAAHVLVLGLGTTLGIVVQAVGLWPALRRAGFRWRWRWDFRALGLRELARLGSWMLLFVAVSQVGVVVVLMIAKKAANDGGFGPVVFNTGFLLFMMAHGIVAVSIITALLPRMSAAAADGRHADLAEQLALGTRLAAVILVPTAAAYVVLGQPIAVVLFQRGQYDTSAAVATGWVIAVAGVALVPYTISQLQLVTFYALSDTRTPALINIPVVALRLSVDIALWLVLPATVVVAGLMAGSAISFVAGAVLGYWLLRRRLGPLGLAAVARGLARLGLAGIVGAVPAAAVVWGVRAVAGDGWWPSLGQLVGGGATLLAGYVGAAVLLRVPEVGQVGRTLRGRIRRS
ncbi:MAG TPA: murein biosynthesis integral membrane protein MurJ [Micromonosporaceae bacterium]|nr:murein biosynthesis integral membrane protein MurJ [Micromonosporaceae bacterium]